MPTAPGMVAYPMKAARTVSSLYAHWLDLSSDPLFWLCCKLLKATGWRLALATFRASSMGQPLLWFGMSPFVLMPHRGIMCFTYLMYFSEICERRG